MFLRSIRRGQAVSYLKSCVTTNRKAMGGVKIFYQHVICLRELGYDAHPLALGEFDGNLFYPEIESKTVKDTGLDLKENDIVVASEFCPYDGLKFKNPVKILFAQSWLYVLPRKDRGDRYKSYRDIGYDHVISCGEYISKFIEMVHNEKCVTIQNGVDDKVFSREDSVKEENRILCLPRKNPEDIKMIKTIVEREIPEATFILADGLTESEIASEYRKSDIFLSSGYPEGFGLAPLEAIFSGCVVVGFAGRGAREYLVHEKAALIAEDGDFIMAAEYLIKVLKDKVLKERLRENSQSVIKKYTIEAMKARIAEYYASL